MTIMFTFIISDYVIIIDYMSDISLKGSHCFYKKFKTPK